jgi:hypothetical protein
MSAIPAVSQGDRASNPPKVEDAPSKPEDPVGSSKKPERKTVPLWLRALRHVGLAQRQPDDVRLVTDVESLRAWASTREKAVPGSEGHYNICIDLLDKAFDAAKAKDAASGYEYLHSAERESVYLMTQQELNIRSKSLRAEAKSADKFGNSWRAGTILELLGEGPKDNFCAARPTGNTSDVLPQALADAVDHRNTLARNDHRKADKLRWQLSWLVLFVLVLVTAAFFLVIKWPLVDKELAEIYLLPYCIYLGLLGGIVSSAITQRNADRKARVPELEVGFYAALARGALGAATAIPVYFLVKTGLITLGHVGDKVSVAWGLLFLCFFAGFSERWFLSSITTVARDDKKEKPNEVPSKK